MPKFFPGDIVKVGRGDNATLARIVQRDGTKYRVFTANRTQRVVDSRLLTNQKRAVLVLESNLSQGRQGLRSDQQRRVGIFFEEFFRSLGLTVLREKVHSAADFARFMKMAQHQDVIFVHWSGHGGAAANSATGPNRLSCLQFTHDMLYLPEQEEATLLQQRRTGKRGREQLSKSSLRDVDDGLEQYKVIHSAFAKLAGKILVFSACNIGKAKGLAQYISAHSGAKAVVTYDGLVADHESQLAESLLYFKMAFHENKRRTVAKLVSEVQASLRSEDDKTIPLACFVEGKRVA